MPGASWAHGMTTDTTLVLFGALRLATINRLYSRRVVQRRDRGEITAEEAAQLLIAAAQRRT